MSRPRRVLAALVSAAVLTACGAGVAAAADGWLPGPSFGAAAIPKGAPAPSLLVAPDGTVTASWNQLAAYDDRTVATLQRILPDGRRQPQIALAPSSNESVVGAAAPGPAGSTLAVVSAPDPDVYDADEVWLVTVDAAGTISSSRKVADGAELVASLGIGTDAAGNAVVTWAAYDDVAVEVKLHAQRFGADGTSGPVQTLGHVAWGAPQVALTADGVARIAWSSQGANAPWLARLTPAGQLDGVPLSVADQGAAGVTVEGADAVAWWVEDDGTVTVVRAPSSGPLTGAQVMHANGYYYDPTIPSVAVDLAADGTTTVAWSAGVAALGQVGLRVRTVAPGGAVVGEGDVVPPALLRFQLAPQLVPAGPGRFLAAWLDYTLEETRIVAREVAADGSGGPESVLDTMPSQQPQDLAVALASGVSDAGVVSLGWLGRREADGADRYTLSTAKRDTAPPALTAEASAAAQVGAPASFTASASDPSGVASLRWEFGDDSGSDRATTTHVYGAAGTYVATATAVDAAGNTATVRRSVVVSAVQTPPDRTPGGSAPTRAPARLKLTKVVRSGRTVRVTGTLDRRASGRVALTWSQRLGRFTVRRSFGATIARGRFAAVLRLPAALARSRAKATVTAAYRGDADTRAATARRTVKAPKATRARRGRR